MIAGTKHHFSRSLAVACMAVLVLNGCGRRPSQRRRINASWLHQHLQLTRLNPPSETAVKKRFRMRPSSPPPTSQPESGQQLYARHCAACHGERGDGRALLLRSCFPNPETTYSGRFRLVSTNNNVPTREDLNAVFGPRHAGICHATVDASDSARSRCSCRRGIADSSRRLSRIVYQRSKKRSS